MDPQAVYHPFLGLSLKILFEVLQRLNLEFFFSAGILALLEEPAHELKEFALKKLLTAYTTSNDRGLSILDVFWAEISEALPRYLISIHSFSNPFYRVGIEL